MNNSFFVTKNWEMDVSDVQIERCESGEDPLGYRAIFVLCEERNRSYSVGASALLHRARSLALAGYKAPMTQRAIRLVESRLGGAIPALAN